MQKCYSVGQINTYIKNLINSDYLLSDITIKGEVSNCKYHSTGHIYFSLKDETGSIAALMFRSYASTMNFKMQNGQSVIVRGAVNVYERDGKYQLYAKAIKLDGSGNLYEEYERLKEKLYNQGLFEFDIKKPIPKYPKKVGIVTAQTGAAIQDILNIAKRRNPFVQLYLYPSKVQGEGAGADIAKGIEVLDKMGLDTIIIGRGGGSIEDLWAFNEEVVAWAIYNAKTPIISGTGHEIDNTIADYAADLRAPTPSAACEMALPDVMSVINDINQRELYLDKLMERRVEFLRGRVQYLDSRLKLLSPENQLKEKQNKLDRLTDKIVRLMTDKYSDKNHRLIYLTEKINGLSPTAKLINGFGYIENNGKPVKSVKDVKAGDEINITINDGDIKAIAK